MRAAVTYIWTTCAAGWFVIAVTLDHVPAFFVCLGCLCLAAWCNEVMPD